MPLWKITDNGPSKVKETKFKQEKLLEEYLEDRITADPSVLVKPLLVFGRQNIIPDTKDRLDLLAVDAHGSITMIDPNHALLPMLMSGKIRVYWEASHAKPC